jgi:hypothetical protein
MELNAERIDTREKLILVGLYLSKYDSLGLKRLGFDGFAEAFNALGYAMGSKPASIKNYRDEFDPLFPNRRKGWHKRKTREYCLRVFEEYGSIDLNSFTSLIESFVGYDENARSEFRDKKKPGGGQSQFAQRLITGLAAERYFESVRPRLTEFKGYTAKNTTSLGCGYDFRLDARASKAFLAVEVKGMNGVKGNLSLTPKEHNTAAELADRFFLFVVKNFRETPFHEIFRNPLSGRLNFRRMERVMVQISWLTNI